MNILKYAVCTARGKHSYTTSIRKPGFLTCTRCGHRHDARTIEVANSDPND